MASALCLRSFVSYDTNEHALGKTEGFFFFDSIRESEYKPRPQRAKNEGPSCPERGQGRSSRGKDHAGNKGFTLSFATAADKASSLRPSEALGMKPLFPLFLWRVGRSTASRSTLTAGKTGIFDTPHLPVYRFRLHKGFAFSETGCPRPRVKKRKDPLQRA